VLPDGARFCANCGRPGLYLPALIAERADGLVGRAWALDAVWQWLRDDGPRCLLVSGGPGSGKTALMAWLAGAGPRPSGPTMATQLAEVRQRLSAAHFCIAETHRGSVDPGRFTRLVFVQLADHHKLYADLVKQLAPEIVLQIQQEFRENWGQVTGLIVQTLNVGPGRPAEALFNTLVRDPLEAYLDKHPNDRIVILVDALDEALTSLDPLTIVDLVTGAADLPKQVRWLLTTRDDLRVSDLLSPRSDYQILDLARGRRSDQQRDLHAYVTGRLATQPVHLPKSGAPLAEALTEHANGNFLYIRFLLDEIEAGHRSPADLSGLPDGLFGLYRDHLLRLLPNLGKRGDRSWPDLYRPLLGCIAVATPAAPRALLAHWIGQPETEVRDALIAPRRLVDDERGPDSGIRLYHHSMTDFLHADTIHQADGSRQPNRLHASAHDAHELISRYYLDQYHNTWDGDWIQCDEYGLNALAFHLASHGQAASLQALISEAWMRAREARGGDYGAGFLGKVQTYLTVEKSGSDGHVLGEMGRRE